MAAAVPDVSAGGAVLWDPADQRALYGKEEATGRPMASTTKIMTVLLALEADTLDDTVTVSASAASQGGASLGLVSGQRLPMRSLLAGLMLRSGNDAAQVVAEHVAGSESAFVALMNRRAEQLGLDATRFLNPTGLTDDPGHHASPLDLARLAEQAMADPDFAQWAGAARLTVPGLGTMDNRNELLTIYRGATGVKTGYTALSRFSLVGSATRDGRTLYTTVLGSEDNFADTVRLLDHGFDDFRRAEPAEPGPTVTRYRWADTAVDLLAAESLGATVPVHADVAWRTTLTPSHRRPLPAGSRLGQALLLVDGDVVQRVDLHTKTAVDRPEEASAATRAGAAVHEALRTFLRLHTVDRPA